MIASCALREKRMKRRKNNIMSIQLEAHYQATASQQLDDLTSLEPMPKTQSCTHQQEISP